MKHTMITFKLHRRGVVLLALGSVLAAGLLFVGGCLVGEWRAGGPAEASAEAAEAAGEPGRQRAGALGTGGAAAAGAAATSSPLAGPPEMPDRFTLRLGAFPSEEEAQALVERLAARGYTAAVSPVTARHGATLHLVLVGSYASRWEARGAGAELERREERDGLRAVVVPAPQ